MIFLVRWRALKDDVIEEEKTWKLAVNMLAIYGFFPLFFVRSIFWGETDDPLPITRRARKSRFDKEGKVLKICQVVGMSIGSFFTLIVAIAIYYAPLASLVMYQIQNNSLSTSNQSNQTRENNFTTMYINQTQAPQYTHVTMWEAYIPFVAMLVTGLIFAVGEAVQANLNKRFAEEEWLTAQLRVRQSLVKASPLDPTLADLPFDGMRLLDGGNFNAETVALRLKFQMKAELERQNRAPAKMYLGELLQPLVCPDPFTASATKVTPLTLVNESKSRLDNDDVRISVPDPGGRVSAVERASMMDPQAIQMTIPSRQGKLISRPNIDRVLTNGKPNVDKQSSRPNVDRVLTNGRPNVDKQSTLNLRRVRMTLAGGWAPAKRREGKNKFDPIPKPYGLAVVVHPDGLTLDQMEEAIKKKIPLKRKDDEESARLVKVLAKDFSKSKSLRPPKDTRLAMPAGLTDLGVMEVTLSRVPAWAVQKRMSAAERKDKRRKRSFMGAVIGYYRAHGLRGFVAFLFAVLLAGVHVLIPGLSRLHENGAVAFTASNDDPDIFEAGVFIACSFPSVLTLLLFLQAACFHYLGLRKCLCAIIDLTDPKAAATQHYSHFLPLDKAVNVEYWSLLRQSAKSKADSSMNTVVAATMVIMVLLMGSALLRALVDPKKRSFDIFNTLALFDIVVLAFYLVQLIIVLVALNTKVQLGSLECLERAKLKISIDRDKLQEILKDTKEEQASMPKGHPNAKESDRVSDRDQDEEDSKQRRSIEEKLEAIKTTYVILESSLSVMKTLDEPIKILGLTVDQVFFTQMLGLLGAGVGSTLFTFIIKQG